MNDYKKDNRKDIEIKPLYEHKSAEDIIERIEMEADNSIESIDFFLMELQRLYASNVLLLVLVKTCL
ncbi:hypothetical protein CKH23_17530 [Salmonella enterica]|nr:hypothetical protein [Salmonella enterica]